MPKLHTVQKVSDSNFSCSFQEVKAYHFIFANTFFFAALEKQPLRFLDSQVTDDWLLKYNTFFVSSCGTTVKKCIAKRQKLADVCEHPLKLNCIKSSFFSFSLHAPLRKTGRPQSNFLARHRCASICL